MKSPFPGMDPYIEASGLWGDFHSDLIAGIKAALAQAAPKQYFVRTEKRSYTVLVGEQGKEDRPFVPDVSVTVPEGRKKPSRKRGAAAVAEVAEDVEAVTMRAFIAEEQREAFVEIYTDIPERRLVTCVEVLSPSNKRPGTEGWGLYVRKRQDLMLGYVNLVEIDLLRGGRRMPMLDPWPDCPYALLVARVMRNHRCRVWPAYSLRPLPRIPVPLAEPDPDISLDLQPIIDAIYERSRYAQDIDYSKPLGPPLAAEESAWLERQLRARQGQK
jgi:hypothetical protein